MEKLKPFSTKINIIRLIADMQVCTTYKTIRNFLHKSQISHSGGKVLDVGCGDQPYRFLFSEPHIKDVKYVPMDWEGAEEGFDYSSTEVIHYDGIHFPQQEASFDMVFHTEVAEHVQDVKYFFKECYRVLKEGGELLFSMPFAARYHYIPYDYWRLTPSSIRMILEDAGFKDIKIDPRSTDITVACYKVLSIGYRWVLSRNILKILMGFLFLPVWAIALLMGQLSIWLNIGEKEDCLGYTVYAKKE